MKKVVVLVAVTITVGFTSCGGGGNADADMFCDCFAKFEAGEKDACEDQMEQLEEDFKNDEARYNAFAEAARKSCPDAEKYINRMK